MELLYELFALFLLSSIFFAVDGNRCDNGNLILFVHHFIATFFRFWWLSNNIYMLFLFAVAHFIYISVRMMNGNKCPLTKMHNEECGRPYDTKFDDLFNKIGLSKYDWWITYGDKIMVVVLWIFVVYKLYQKQRVLKKFNGKR